MNNWTEMGKNVAKKIEWDENMRWFKPLAIITVLLEVFGLWRLAH